MINMSDVNTKSKVRYRSLDVLRGFLVFAVVYAHLLFLSDSLGGGDSDGGELALPLQILYLGLMGFLVISGCLYVRGTGFSDHQKKRLVYFLVAIVLSTLILPVIMYVYLAALGQSVELSQFQYVYRTLLGELAVFMPYGEFPLTPIFFVQSAYYYLWTMFFGFIVFYSIADKVLESRRNTVVSIIILVLITAVLREICNYNLPYNLPLIPLAVAFMIIGAVVRNEGLLDCIENEVTGRRFWLLFTGALVVAIVMSYFFHPGVNFYLCYFGVYGGWSAFTYFVAASAFCVAALCLASCIARIPAVGKALMALGRHSLGIMLYHLFIIKLLVAPYHTLTLEYTLPTFTMPEIGVVGIVSIVLCMVVCVYGPVLLKKLSGLVGRRKSES